MTDYATTPVTGSVYGDDGGVSELIADAWLSVDVSIPADVADHFDDRRILAMGPSSLFLVFEQGRNADPCVFALKSAPEQDLAWADGFTLHYLPDDPSAAVYPQALRDFYRPVAELVDRLAGETGRPVQERSIEVMTLLLARIAAGADR